MEKIYFNHSRLIDSPGSEFSRFVLEIKESKDILGSIPLHVYSKFWDIPLQQGTLSSRLNKPVYRDEAIILISNLMNNGPYFYAPDRVEGLEISPAIPQNKASSFAVELMNICFNDEQKFILSLMDEKILYKEKYTLKNTEKSLEISNLIGNDKLSASIDESEKLGNIEAVFGKVERECKHIKILPGVRKSAQRHDFKGAFRKIYNVIKALETEMDRVLTGVPDRKRIEAFRQDTGLDISPESNEVSENPKFRKHREFYIESPGKKEYFEWHIKIGRDTRIHYFIDKERKTIYIGHCGKHLPVPSYNS